FPQAAAGLIRVSEEIGIVAGRIRVDGEELHVVSIVEDVLRAITVVIVHVEYRDARCAARAKVLSRGRGVVDEAISAIEGARRVMPRWPAQSERALFLA